MRVVFTSMCLAVAALAGCAAIPDGMPHSSPVQAATLGLVVEVLR
jgi:starvation-inducible outer membrane lipoprotein